MGQSSARKRTSPVTDPIVADPVFEPAPTYRLVDVIEVKVSYGAPAPGFVLVPEGFHPPAPESLVGEVVIIHGLGPRDNRYSYFAKIAAVRNYGTTSVLVENWPSDTPPPRVGWSIQVPNALGPSPEPPEPRGPMPPKKAG